MSFRAIKTIFKNIFYKIKQKLTKSFLNNLGFEIILFPYNIGNVWNSYTLIFTMIVMFLVFYFYTSSFYLNLEFILYILCFIISFIISYILPLNNSSSLGLKNNKDSKVFTFKKRINYYLANALLIICLIIIFCLVLMLSFEPLNSIYAEVLSDINISNENNTNIDTETNITSDPLSFREEQEQ
jgi:hypothetical protein